MNSKVMNNNSNSSISFNILRCVFNLVIIDGFQKISTVSFLTTTGILLNSVTYITNVADWMQLNLDRNYHFLIF